MDGHVLMARMRSWSMFFLALVLVTFLIPSAMNSDDNAYAATGNYAPDEFVTTWKTDNPGVSASNQVTITTFTIGGAPYTYNYNVDWGDGTTSTALTSGIVHTYALPGIYEIKITGKFPAFLAGNDSQKLLSVEQWGTNKWETTAQAFYGATNAQIPALDNPDLSDVANISRMFTGATSFNSDISDWDVSNITSMADMFSGASSFNKPLNDWDVSNVQYFGNMFYGASAFNQPLNSWDVSSAIDMKAMFVGASSFNQPLGNWDVRNVTSMEGMFNRTAVQALMPGIGSVTLNPSGLTTVNYDNTLIGWSALGLKNNVRFDAGTSTYCDSEEERQSIIDTFTWTINDSGPNCAPVVTVPTTPTQPTVVPTDPTVPGTVTTSVVSTAAPTVNVAGISLSSLPRTGADNVALLLGTSLLLIVLGIVSLVASRRKSSLIK